MAFRGRGSFNNNSVSNSLKSGGARKSYLFHRHIHVYKDYNEYLFCQMISLLVLAAIIVIGVIISIFSYESPYIYDPLAIAKSNFLDVKFFWILFGIVLTIISITKIKTKNSFKFIFATLLCLLVPVMISGYTLITFNAKYNAVTFSEMYKESYVTVENANNEKELFVSECLKLNEKFQMKIIIISILEYAIIFVNLFLLFSEITMNKKYEKIEKENEVLFDEEINVKI